MVKNRDIKKMLESDSNSLKIRSYKMTVETVKKIDELSAKYDITKTELLKRLIDMAYEEAM